MLIFIALAQMLFRVIPRPLSWRGHGTGRGGRGAVREISRRTAGAQRNGDEAMDNPRIRRPRTAVVVHGAGRAGEMAPVAEAGAFPRSP